MHMRMRDAGCVPMQTVVVVGSIPELGNWDITKAPRMNW